MADPFASHGTGLNSPARNATAITPANSDLANVTRGLWVGGAGDVAVMLQGDSAAVTISGVAAGTLLPLACKQVRSTGTTATLIIGLW